MNKLNRRNFLKCIPLLFVSGNLKSKPKQTENQFESGDSVAFFRFGIYHVGLVQIKENKICVWNSGHCTIFGTKENPINQLILLPRREDGVHWKYGKSGLV